MNYEGLKVEQIVREKTIRWGKEELSHLKVQASNDEVSILISCPKGTNRHLQKMITCLKVSEILTEFCV